MEVVIAKYINYPSINAVTDKMETLIKSKMLTLHLTLISPRMSQQ